MQARGDKIELPIDHAAAEQGWPQIPRGPKAIALPMSSLGMIMNEDREAALALGPDVLRQAIFTTVAREAEHQAGLVGGKPDRYEYLLARFKERDSQQEYAVPNLTALSAVHRFGGDVAIRAIIETGHELRTQRGDSDAAVEARGRRAADSRHARGLMRQTRLAGRQLRQQAADKARQVRTKANKGVAKVTSGPVIPAQPRQHAGRTKGHLTLLDPPTRNR